MSRSLHDAIRGNKEDEVRIRLNLGEDIDMRHPPRYEQRHGMSGKISFLSSSIISFDTPLHVAVEAGHENIVRILCERKAKLNFLNGKSENALTLANRYKSLFLICIAFLFYPVRALSECTHKAMGLHPI